MTIKELIDKHKEGVPIIIHIGSKRNGMTIVTFSGKPDPIFPKSNKTENEIINAEENYDGIHIYTEDIN